MTPSRNVSCVVARSRVVALAASQHNESNSGDDKSTRRTPKDVASIMRRRRGSSMRIQQVAQQVYSYTRLPLCACVVGMC